MQNAEYLTVAKKKPSIEVCMLRLQDSATRVNLSPQLLFPTVRAMADPTRRYAWDGDEVQFPSKNTKNSPVTNTGSEDTEKEKKEAKTETKKEEPEKKDKKEEKWRNRRRRLRKRRRKRVVKGNLCQTTL